MPFQAGYVVCHKPLSYDVLVVQLITGVEVGRDRVTVALVGAIEVV